MSDGCTYPRWKIGWSAWWKLYFERYKNKRLGLYYKHFKIKEVLDLNPLHPIINKLRQFIIPIIKSNVYLSNTGADPSFKFPVNNQLVGLNKISSKNIRESIQVNEMVTPKLLNNINGGYYASINQLLEERNSLPVF